MSELIPHSLINKIPSNKLKKISPEELKELEEHINKINDLDIQFVSKINEMNSGVKKATIRIAYKALRVSTYNLLKILFRMGNI